MSWTIYCHTHTESGRRYIGLTKLTVLKRWNSHVYSANRVKQGKPAITGHFPNAIRRYGKEAFSHETLEVCDTLEAANSAEEKWINFYDSINPEKGFNLAKGGGHIPNPIKKNPWNDPEFRARQRAIHNSPEFRLKVSEATRQAMASPEIREKSAKALKEKWKSSEYREKQKNKAYWISPEYRMKQSIKSKEKWKSSEYREKHLKALIKATNTPEIRLKRSITTKIALNNSEARIRLSEAAKRNWKNQYGSKPERQLND